MDKFKECMHHDIGIGGMGCSCCNNVARKGRNRKDPELHRTARSRMNMDVKKVVEEGVEDWDNRTAEYWDEELNDWVPYETVTTRNWEKIGTHSLSLPELEKRLDESLESETPESLNEWLKEQRKHEN